MAGIEDSYTAYCFDEAVAVVVTKIRDGEKPVYRQGELNKKEYSRPSDLYSKFSN